jgi:S-adenosylmethionine:tRNA ribosyltransferase-isomerase
LLILSCAFGGYELIMEAYKKAVKEEYKFSTYGDAMLVL